MQTRDVAQMVLGALQLAGYPELADGLTAASRAFACIRRKPDREAAENPITPTAPGQCRSAGHDEYTLRPRAAEPR